MNILSTFIKLFSYRRIARKKVEKTIIDMVIVSSDLITDIDSLEIDESRNHVLTRIQKT